MLSILYSIKGVIKGRLSCARKAAMKIDKADKTKGYKRQSLPIIYSYQTLNAKGGAESAKTQCLSMSSKNSPPKGQIVPVSNLPCDNSDKGMPSHRDFTIYRLKQRIAMLSDSERNLLGKLSRCLELIAETERYLSVGLQYSQWETYDELMARRAKLRAFIDLIVDPVAEQHVSEKEAAALKEKFKL